MMNNRKEAFEKWAEEQGYHLRVLGGRYAFEATRRIWEAWQEACDWVETQPHIK